MSAPIDSACAHVERTAAQAVGERLPLDVLHHDERPPVRRGADVVDRADAGMVERGRGPRLLDETAFRRGVAGTARRHELDRHGPIEIQVLREEHLAHAARAERADDLVFREEPGARVVGHSNG